MQIVQVVPDGGAAGAGQVNIGIQDFLLVCRGYGANRPAIGAGDQRASEVAGTSFLTDPAGSGDKHIVDVCRRHRQVRRHAFAGIVEQRRRCPDPVVDAANDVGALLTQDAWHLGKPDIPANQHADSTNRRIKNRKPQIAGCEPEFLQVPQMRLSILPDKPVRADQHRGVEQSHAVAFRQAGHKIDVVPAGKIDPQLRLARRVSTAHVQRHPADC